jgi:hypothetical protein
LHCLLKNPPIFEQIPPPGDVEVIILKEEKQFVPVDEILSLVPKRRVGEIQKTLRREDIYTDAR